ncbi:hypothetical protein C818_02601, partial [Lachnospiraceae bacterium MD308]
YKKVGKKTKYSKWSAKKAVTVRKTGSVSSGHVHSYTIPVTEKRTVMKQVPFSQAKYQRGDNGIKGTSSYFRVEYGALTYDSVPQNCAINGYFSRNSVPGTPGASYTFLEQTSKEDMMGFLEDEIGWVELKYTGCQVCQKCGYVYSGDEENRDACNYSWRSDEIVVETVVHKATPTTQTVTVGKKCSCGKIRYN